MGIKAERIQAGIRKSQNTGYIWESTIVYSVHKVYTAQVTHLCICSGLSGPPSSVQARVAWLRLGKEQRRRKGEDEPPGLSWTAGERERSGSVSRRSRERWIHNPESRNQFNNNTGRPLGSSWHLSGI